MSKAAKVMELLQPFEEKDKDPGEKEATDQVSKLQKFDFEHVDGRKKYKPYKK